MVNADVRPVAKLWSERMERVLERNDHKEGWLGMTDEQVLVRLEEEIQEALRLLWRGECYGPRREQFLDELADVSNFAAFLSDPERIELQKKRPWTERV